MKEITYYGEGYSTVLPPGEWHHIIVSPDASVLIIENADTSEQNTDKYPTEGGDC